MRHLPVTNDKFQPGIRKLTDVAPKLMLVEFDAVFDKEWTSDVHFMCYGVREPGAETLTEDAFPRINKPALTEIREAGGDVLVGVLTLDLDLKDQPGSENLALDSEGKPCWDTEQIQSFIEAMPGLDAQLAAKNIAAPLIYTTTHGARFVHKLSEPVVCEDAEDLLRGMHKIYGDLGLIVDPLSDWTRLFRAPKVVRGRSKTWTERWFWLRPGTGATSPSVIDPITRRSAHRDSYAKIEPITSDRPTPEQVHALLFTPTTSGEKPTEMQRLAQRILRGTDCYGPCFEGRSLATEGTRDSTLIRLVGQACAYLLGPMSQEYTFQPEDVFAIFMAPVEDLEPDSGTPDWLESLWRKVCSCYERERAKLKSQETLEAEKREQASQTVDTLLQVVRRHCQLPELHSDDAVTAQTALHKLMLIKEPSGRFRAMKPEGGYTNIAVAFGGLHYLIDKAAQISDQIDLWTVDAKGNPKQVSENILARQATEIRRIEGAVGIEHSQVTGKTWDNLTLRVCLYKRNPDLNPEFCEEVQDWLDLLTTEPRVLCRWLAYSLDFEGGPICALSLAGASGAGKGMLAQGLVETLANPVRADKSVLVTRFNATLAQTPFLIVDEGLPSGDRDITDTFRSLTAGEPISVEEKYQSVIEVRNPMRLLFIANNRDVVEQLASHRINDSDDQAALAMRLLHLNVSDRAEMHLRVNGGLRYTRGWVQGADGSASNFVVARHLLWLYENRYEKFGDPAERFLVQGCPNAEVVQSLRIAGRVPQAIARALLTALEAPATPAISERVVIAENRLYVTAGAIVEQHRQLHETNVQLNPVLVGRALRNMVTPGVKESVKKRLLMPDGQETQQQRWWDIDVRLLWDYAEHAGYARDKLKALVEKQYGNQIIF